MSVRNRLSAGSYITLIPIGVPITLEYSEGGIIHKLYKGMYSKGHYEELPFELLSSLLKHEVFPNSINVIGGTTYVEGVLYTSKFPDMLEYTDANCEIPMNKLQDNPEVFTFYAVATTSLAAKLSGSRAIRQWFVTCKFNVLPGYLVTEDIEVCTIRDLEKLIKSNYPFMYPLVPVIHSYKPDDSEYISLDLVQEKIVSVDTYVDMLGFIVSKVVTEKQTLYLNYSDIVRFNIHVGSIIFLDAFTNILYTITDTTKAKNKRYPATLHCKYCGKLIDVPDSGKVRCSNINCISNMYSRFKHMCKVLELPYMNAEVFKDIREHKGSAFMLFDIFTLPEYAETVVKCSISQYIRSILTSDIDYIHHDDIVAFCNMCNNSVQTVSHYIHNPNEIKSDLSIDIYENNKVWLDWFVNDPQNILIYDSGLTLDNIVIDNKERKFYGPPIFRNKKIRLTGKFMRGSYEEIDAILSSYSAEVVKTDNMDCLIIGDMKENIDSKLVMNARKSLIPIFTESEFFTKYDIDSDILNSYN